MVECNLAKVEVASSNLVSRSTGKASQSTCHTIGLKTQRGRPRVGSTPTSRAKTNQGLTEIDSVSPFFIHLHERASFLKPVAESESLLFSQGVQRLPGYIRDTKVNPSRILKIVARISACVSSTWVARNTPDRVYPRSSSLLHLHNMLFCNNKYRQ